MNTATRSEIKRRTRRRTTLYLDDEITKNTKGKTWYT